MVFATLAPGPRPFLRSPVEVLGATETPTPVEESTTAARREIPSNDDWNGPLFGLTDSNVGDDAVLDDLHQRCGEQDHLACDVLMRSVQESRSSYELWGLTCGARTDLITGTCAERFGEEQPNDLELGVGDCLVLARSSDGTDQRVSCDRPHDGQIISSIGSPNALTAADGGFLADQEVFGHLERVCEATAYALIDDEAWNYPTDLRAGLLPPSADSENLLFHCMLWAPGWALEAPLVLTQ